LFFKCVQMFHHKPKTKDKKGKSSSSSQARSGMFANLLALMILLNFYLHVLIHYYFIASYLIYFIVAFVCSALWPPETDRRPFLGLCMTGVSRRWPERGQRFLRLPRSWRSDWPSRRLTRSRTSKRPSTRRRTSERTNTKLQRSPMSRTRSVTSHRSPIGYINFNSFLMIFYIIKVTNSILVQLRGPNCYKAGG
jgi:hypothetical protein